LREGVSLEIGFDRFVLFVEEGHVWDEIADNVHMWKGINFGICVCVCVDARETGEGVYATDVHPNR
jgi:hypothetical protein